MNVEEIRKIYPEGTQIELEEMHGEPQMDYGLKGTVSSIVCCESNRQCTKHNKNNIGTEKSVDTCRDCGYHIRLYLFLDHKTGGICGQ